MIEPVAEAIDTIVQRTMQERAVPGVAVGVTRNGAITHARGYGVMNLETRQPVTAETLFHQASVTKLFVGTALLQLAETGKLDLDAPVVRSLPYFRLADPRFAEMTTAQMLSHTSGMPDTEDYGWDRPEYDDGALERYVRSLETLELIAAPGERYAYSNIAFEVLGDVIAKVSGMTFEGYVQRHILAPLKMEHSTLLIRQADPALLASPHLPRESGPARVSTVFPYNRAHAPSSTLYSSAIELSRFALAHLNHGELDGARILQPTAYDLMWTPRAITGDRYWPEIGLPWFIGERNGRRTVAHEGADDGFKSILMLVPEERVSVCAMANLDRAPNEDMADEIMDAVLKE